MKKFLRITAIIIFVIIALIYGILFSIKYYYKTQVRHVFKPEQIEQMEKNRTEKIHFKISSPTQAENKIPERAGIDNTVSSSANEKSESVVSDKRGTEEKIIELETDPSKFVPFSEKTLQYSKEYTSKLTQEIYSDIHSIWENFNDDKTTDTEIHYKNLVKKSDEIEPIINAYINTVNCADYNIEIWEAREPNIDGWMFSCYTPSIMNGNTLLEIKAGLQAKDKKFREALETIETMMRAVHVNKYTSNINRDAMRREFVRACAAYYHVIQDCDSSETLAFAFNHQKVLAAFAEFYEYALSPDLTDSMDIIRTGDRYGFKANVEGLTSEELFAKALEIQADFAEKMEEKNKGKSQNLYHQTSFRYLSVMIGAKPKTTLQAMAKIASPFVKEAIYTNLIYPREFAINENLKKPPMHAKEYYNLLLIETALKLYELRNGKCPDSLDELLGDYFKKIPEDYYSDQNGQWKYKAGKVYSIGVDKKDDNCSAMFNINNGEYSKGDIFFSHKPNAAQ